MLIHEIATDNTMLPVDSLPMHIVRNGDGTIHYADVEYEGKVYRKTYSYVDGALAGHTGWVKQ